MRGHVGLDQRLPKLSKKAGEETQQRLTLPENVAIILPLRKVEALLNVEALEKKLARQVVGTQIAAILLVAGLIYGMMGTPSAVLAVLGGGGISVVNGSLLAWRMSQATTNSVKNVHHQIGRAHV